MKTNELILPFKIGDWVISTDKYIEIRKAQEERIMNYAVQIKDQADLNYVVYSIERYRLATDGEIKKEKIKNSFIHK